MNPSLRIIYAGTPDFSVPTLQALIDSPHQVIAVYTQPDRPSGRGRKIQFSPVKQLALKHQIPIEQPQHLKSDEALQTLMAYQADVMIVAAYGLMLPQTILDAPKYGCLNIHGSILPQWRGAAPIQRAIAAGDKQTGITIMQMNIGLDTGDMLHKSTLTITEKDTGQTIHDQLSIQGAEDIMLVLEQLTKQSLQPESQNNALSSYAHKLSKAEAEIDWSQSAQTIDQMVRAFNPWPVAYTHQGNKTIKILLTSQVKTSVSPLVTAGTSDKPHASPGTVINESKAGIEVSTGDGNLLIHRLQIPGKKAMNVTDYLNGHSLAGSQFHSKSK